MGHGRTVLAGRLEGTAGCGRHPFLPGRCFTIMAHGTTPDRPEGCRRNVWELSFSLFYTSSPENTYFTVHRILKVGAARHLWLCTESMLAFFSSFHQALPRKSASASDTPKAENGYVQRKSLKIQPPFEVDVERARSARSTASTSPIVTIRITLISDPDTWIDGALMAASIMSRVPLRHQARPNMVCAHYVVCINMRSPTLCNTSLLSSLPPSPSLLSLPLPSPQGKT